MLVKKVHPKTSSNVEMQFSGSPEEVEVAVERFLNDYGFGYMARVKSDRTENGVRVVEVTRWDNCD